MGPLVRRTTDRTEGASGDRRRPRRPLLRVGRFGPPWAAPPWAWQAIQRHLPFERCGRVRPPPRQSGSGGCRWARHGRRL